MPEEETKLPEATKPSKVLAQTNLEAILQRVANGEYSSRIADELGVSKQILSYHLRKNDKWAAIMETAHESRLDTAYHALNEAIAQRDFDLARAREGQLKRLEWRASVECPSRWGQTNKLQVQVTDDLGDRLRRARNRVIDVAPEQQRSAQETETLPIMGAVSVPVSERGDLSDS